MPSKPFSMNPIAEVLQRRFSYFKALSVPEKERFLGRIADFLEEKYFEPRGGITITQEMKILISASAIQLTFGLDNYLLSHFDKILVYPEKFYSPFSKTVNTGEVNTAGAIVLSWKDFEGGIANETDSRNVGLHEFAHALYYCHLVNIEIDEHFSGYFDKWYVYGRKYLDRKGEVQSDFFRRYASTNIEEFFAVGIEYFFEVPEKFRSYNPDLYYHFTMLLKQDPLNRDYLPKERYHKDYLTGREKPVFPLTNSYFNPMISLGIAVTVLVLLLYQGMWGYALFGLAISFFLLYINVISFNNVIFYDDFLKVFNPVKLKKERVFALDQVLSFNYYDQDRSKPFIEISVFNNGEIHSYTTSGNANFHSYEPLFSWLYHEKNILVKKNDRVYLPQNIERNVTKNFKEKWPK